MAGLAEGPTVVPQAQLLPQQSVFARQELGAEGVADMIELKHAHEPALLDNLERRFATHKIYVWMDDDSIGTQRDRDETTETDEKRPAHVQ